MRLFKGDIVSFNFYSTEEGHDKLRVGMICSVRNLKSNPTKKELRVGSKYLYSILEYNGEFKYFYDNSMKDIIKLSGRQFKNVGLEKRFKDYKKKYAEEKEKKTSQMDWQDDISRLKIGVDHCNKSCRFIFFSDKILIANFKYFDTVDKKLIITVEYPNIKTTGKINGDKIKEIVIR